MTEQTGDIEALQQLKQSVRTRFSKIYAVLMAREKETLDQLDAIYNYLQKFGTKRGNYCVQNLRISYDNEATILNNISSLGAVDLQNDNFDNGIFQHGDNKTSKELQSTSTDGETNIDNFIPNSCRCYCHNIQVVDNTSRKEYCDREFSKERSDKTCGQSSYDSNKNKLVCETSIDNRRYQNEEMSSEQSLEAKVKDSTQEWLDSIKDQVETEPCQVSGELEHSALACL